MGGDYLMPVRPVLGSGSPSWYTYAIAHAIKVRGRLSDPRHIELDEPVNDLTGSVEVVVQQAQPRPLTAPSALFDPDPRPGFPDPNVAVWTLATARGHRREQDAGAVERSITSWFTPSARTTQMKQSPAVSNTPSSVITRFAHPSAVAGSAATPAFKSPTFAVASRLLRDAVHDG